MCIHLNLMIFTKIIRGFIRLKPPLQKYTMVESYFFPMSPRYQNKIKEYQLMHQISILKPK
ncbi:hypothetical protein DDA05_10820 [Escherichia coli]|nr:hypothetical protein [Escherichia coli]RCP48417.1 hypothetical protein A6576_23030 [Escherichia coli]TEV29567.1 hypothetical protein E2135_20440 [Escherichia coli]